ncbi:unnamed protein product [Leuciscus chuanchicus]
MGWKKTQEVYNFFSASTSRWDVLGDVYDALLSVAEDDSLTGTCGAKTRCEARGIAAKIKTYPFMCSIITWYNILYEINVTSKILQTTSLDVPCAVAQLNLTKRFLVDYRTDSSFERVLSNARVLVEDLETEARFPPQSAVRPRKREKKIHYEGEDEAVMDPQQDYKEHRNIFGVLYDIASIKEKNATDVLQEKAWKKLEKALTHGDYRDVDGQELFAELTALTHNIPRGILGTINPTCCAKDQRAASEPAGQRASIHGDLPTPAVPAMPTSIVFKPDLLHNKLQLHTIPMKATTPQAFVEAAAEKHNICSPEKQQDPTLLRHVTNSLGLFHPTQIVPEFCPL